MADFLGKIWWAWQGLNLRPLRCQHRSYSPKWLKSAIYDVIFARTGGEQSVNLRDFYRTFTASLTPTKGATHDR